MAGRPLRRSQPGRAGIPWREFLDMPLAAAAHRANGGRTERPVDWEAAMEMLG